MRVSTQIQSPFEKYIFAQRSAIIVLFCIEYYPNPSPLVLSNYIDAMTDDSTPLPIPYTGPFQPRPSSSAHPD